MPDPAAVDLYMIFEKADGAFDVANDRRVAQARLARFVVVFAVRHDDIKFSGAPAAYPSCANILVVYLIKSSRPERP